MENKTIMFGKWKFELAKDFSVHNINYDGLRLIDYLKLSSQQNLKIPQSVLSLLKLNRYTKMNDFLNKEKEVSTFDHVLSKKYILRNYGRAKLATGYVDIKREITVTEKDILFIFKYKGKIQRYNHIFPELIFSDKLSSMSQILKKKRDYRKIKISSQKQFDLHNKYPMLISYDGNPFLMKISTLRMIKKDNVYNFMPLTSGKEKGIVHSWRIKPNIWYSIAFSISLKPDKLKF